MPMLGTNSPACESQKRHEAMSGLPLKLQRGALVCFNQEELQVKKMAAQASSFFISCGIVDLERFLPNRMRKAEKVATPKS